MAKFTKDKLKAIEIVAYNYALMKLKPDYYTDKDEQVVIDANNISVKAPNMPVVGLLRKDKTIDEDAKDNVRIENIRESIADAIKALPKFQPKIEVDSSKTTLKVAYESPGYQEAEANTKKDTFQSPKIEEPIPEPTKKQEYQRTDEEGHQIGFGTPKPDPNKFSERVQEVIAEAGRITKEVKEAQSLKPNTIPIPYCSECHVALSQLRAEHQFKAKDSRKEWTCENCDEKAVKKGMEIINKNQEPFQAPNQGRNRRETMTENKENIPAKVEPKGANMPAKKSDHELDIEIQDAKAKKFLETQAGSYKVSGNEIPDSAQIQKIANEQGVSVQIIESEQTNDYARVRVRGTLGKQSVDGEVWIDFRTETDLLMMEFIEKNKEVLDHFEGLTPVFKEGAKIRKFDGSYQDAKYALIHALLTLRKFAIRSANTKASKIVQMKLLNKEFRDNDEIADEQKEQDLVSSSKKR